MLDDGIRRRIAEAIRRDGRSMRTISKAAGLSENFAALLVRTGRSPSVDHFKMLCEELGITAGYAIFGHDVTPKQEELARKILNLSDDEVRLIEEMVQRLAPSEPQ